MKNNKNQKMNDKKLKNTILKNKIYLNCKINIKIILVNLTLYF